MNKLVVENNIEKQFCLNHKEISMFIGQNNQTKSEPQRFEKQMGYYAANTDSWVFPSPLDAIQAYSSLSGKQ
jgi:hypothetical protein